MTATTLIKQRLEDIGMIQTELAKKAGMTRQNFNNKLSRDNFTTQEFYQVCNILGLKLMAIGNDEKEYPIEYQ